MKCQKIDDPSVLDLPGLPPFEYVDTKGAPYFVCPGCSKEIMSGTITFSCRTYTDPGTGSLYVECYECNTWGCVEE